MEGKLLLLPSDVVLNFVLSDCFWTSSLMFLQSSVGWTQKGDKFTQINPKQNLHLLYWFHQREKINRKLIKLLIFFTSGSTNIKLKISEQQEKTVSRTQICFLWLVSKSCDWKCHLENNIQPFGRKMKIKSRRIRLKSAALFTNYTETKLNISPARTKTLFK